MRAVVGETASIGWECGVSPHVLRGAPASRLLLVLPPAPDRRGFQRGLMSVSFKTLSEGCVKVGVWTSSVRDGISYGGKRGCSTINLGGPKVFTKHNMRCEKAKRKAERVYRTRGDNEPRNFSCSSGSNFEEGGFCQHDSKDKYFGWHPAD